jgi:hypothetical protein
MSFGFDYDGEDVPYRSTRFETAPEWGVTVREWLSFRRSLYRAPRDTETERREARLCAIPVQGRPLGERRMLWRSDDDGDPYYEKSFGELMDLARVLVGSGLDASAADVEPTDVAPTGTSRPDFRLELKDGTVAHAEVARIQIPYAAALVNGATSLRRGIRRRENRNKRFQLSLGGSAITLTLARPLAQRIDEAVDETERLLRWIASDAEEGMRHIEATQFPVLSSVGATCEVLRHQWTIYGFDIDVEPPPWEPDETRAAFRRLLAKKTAKYTGYAVEEPVLLVMPLSDDYRDTDTVLDALRPELDVERPAPFAALVVGTRERAVVLDSMRRGSG